MVSGSTSVQEKVAPPVLTLMLGNSVPPSVSLVPFQLLPECWSSKGVSLSKSVFEPFMRNYLGLWKPLVSFSFNFHRVLQSNYEISSFWHWNPELGEGIVREWDPSLLRWDLFSWDVPSNAYLPPMDVGPAHIASLPLLLFFMCLLFCIPNGWTLLSQISGGSEWWPFCSSVVVLMWLWEVSTVFTYPAVFI